ncbi:MAG: glutamate--cysteine ligase [Chloroflexota bacterium]
MDKKLNNRLSKIANSAIKDLLNGGGKGVEKESLRVDVGGKIAQSPHPQALGSTLTHPAITTDYSEALLELITPPLEDGLETLTYLQRIHQFVYANLKHNELLWVASMPCIIGGEKSIPLAWYGESNVGMMKHIYRRGLDVRYGRIMQAISGIHFNYSVPETFWPFYQEIEEDKQPLQEFINERYLGLARNVLRYEWLVTYLFGSSPAFCKSFMDGQESPFQHYDKSTYYEPYATSLRMSDIGYKNNQQASLAVSYNHLDEYVQDLDRAIRTPYEPYEKIGVEVDGFYRQLNANILQIANEYYSSIRPKQPIHSGESPTSALHKRGIRYVELRAIDVSTFDPTGINAEQLLFLEAFMLFCLLSDSPPIDAEEWKQIQHNQGQSAIRGRDPNLTLQRNGHTPHLKEWASEILDEMTPLCTLLDNGTDQFSNSLTLQRQAIQDGDATPSARTLAEMRSHSESFFEFGLRKSQEHRQTLIQSQLEPEVEAMFATLTTESLQKQAQIEASDELSFAEYLEKYFGQ